MQKAGSWAAKSLHLDESLLDDQQFNTVRTVMSNRLNPSTKWVTLYESWPQESLGRSEKEERYLNLISQDHHLGFNRATTLSPIFRRSSEAASAVMIEVRR